MVKLQGEYDITFQYFNKSPRLDLARYSLAAAAGNLISDKMKRETIIQMEDPRAEEEQLRWEEAERLSPLIKVHRTLKALHEMADRGDDDAKFEAELLEKQFNLALEQPQGQPQEEQTEEPKQPKPLLDLFPKTGAKPSVQKMERGEE